MTTATRGHQNKLPAQRIQLRVLSAAIRWLPQVVHDLPPREHSDSDPP
jgi:hypothetical protein